jgi:glycosyltransferase involved in cell wall biosynthesis
MISFIISAKNEEHYIVECLASVVLQVTKEPIEILVVDNQSTDQTVSKVKRYYPQAKIVSETQPGVVSARQAGFNNVKGEILIFLDADVRLPHKFWLEDLLGLLKPPEVVAVSTHYKYYEMNFWVKVVQTLGTYICIYPWIFFADKVFRKTSHMVGGMMGIKKSALMSIGGFEGNTKFYGDEISIVKKLYPKGKIIVSPKLWVYTSGRRYGKNGLLNTVFKYVVNYFSMLFWDKPYHHN